MNFEKQVINSFKTKYKEFKDLDLLVAIPDSFLDYEDNEIIIMEKQDNGKVFNVVIDRKNQKVIDYYEL